MRSKTRLGGWFTTTKTVLLKNLQKTFINFQKNSQSPPAESHPILNRKTKVE